uniref:DUF4140 domain-containing protein n=1 Tax=Steinernema glaseri TaxID=37863 RepID=A0A1I7Z7Y9_9BILA
MVIPTVTFKATDLPIQSVTVFNDRAQVKRELKTHLEAGVHEVVIENLASSIDGDSIRVDGTGDAEIHEVKYKEEHAVREDIDSPEVKNLVEERKKLQNQKDALSDEKDLLKRQLDSLNSMANKLGSTDGTVLFNEEVEENMTKFFTFYDQRALALHEKMREAERPIEDLENQIDKLARQIDRLRHSGSFSRNIFVTVNVTEESDLTFLLTYQVYEARWYPHYDIRVVSAPSTEEKTVLKMDYFAEIVQNTGEEWTDTKILLSTAQPCQGGNVPELGTFNVSFYVPPPPPEPEPYANEVYYKCAVEEETRRYRSDMEAVPKKARMRSVGMTASQQVLSTEFQLPEKKTIPSDDSEHKM